MTTVPLDTLSLNRGDHAKYRNVRKAIYSAPGGHALVALQEMHSVQHILDDLELDGFGVWRGNLNNSEASPVVWNPAYFEARHFLSFPLLPAAKRAGKHNMAKSLNVVVGQHIASGRRIAFGSCHNIQTQYLPARRRPAQAFVRNVIDACDEAFRCAVIIGADWNATPRGYSLAPLRSAERWDYDQERRPVATHGRRAIDGFAYTDRDAATGVLELGSHRPVTVPGTDHRGNSARWLLTAKESA